MDVPAYQPTDEKVTADLSEEALSYVDTLIETEQSDEELAGGEETNNAPETQIINSSLELDGEHKEKVTAELSEEKLPDAVAERGEKRKDGGGAGPSSVFAANRSCKELDAKNNESSATKKRKTATTSKELSYEVVEEDEQIEPALKKLRELGEGLPLLAVDLEGEHLSRSGELVILSVATEKHVYLFDIKKLGAGVFDKGLRDLLQDPDRQKLMFDCRQDSDCLWHQFNVKLTNVLDLQLMEVVHRDDHMKQNFIAKTRAFSGYLPRVNGFKKCLQKYNIRDQDILQAKELGSQVMKREGVWLEQPLQKALLDYSAADVMGFFKLYEKLKSALRLNNHAVVGASKNYLEFFRSRAVRTNDTFERNGFVPWRIFPTTSGTGPITTCQKCRQGFPRSDFAQSQNFMCPVCMKVKKEVDKGWYK